MYLPENRKPSGFLFSGAQREKIALKWVSLYNYELLESKKFALYYFHPLETILAQ